MACACLGWIALILVASAAATSRRQQSSTSHPVAGAAPYHIDTCAARRAEPQPARRERWQGEQAQLSNSASRPTGRFRPHGVVTVTITVHDMTRQIAWLCLVTAAVPAGKANSLAPFLQLGGLGPSRRLPQPGVPRQTQPIIEYASLKSTVAVPPQRIWACATSVALRSVECVHTTVYCSLVCRQCSTTTRSPEHHPGPRGLLQYASAALY